MAFGSTSPSPGSARPSVSGGGGIGSGILDAPPPNPLNPTFSDLQNPSQANPSGLGSRAPISRELPPEVLMGLLKAGETVSSMIDDMAAMVPDLAPDFAGAKDLFLRALAKLTVAAGGATGPAEPPTSQFAGSAPFPSNPPAV